MSTNINPNSVISIDLTIMNGCVGSVPCRSAPVRR